MCPHKSLFDALFNLILLHLMQYTYLSFTENADVSDKEKELTNKPVRL